MQLVNYSGTAFDLEVDPAWSGSSKPEDLTALGLDVPGRRPGGRLRVEQQITNTGTAAWTKDTGLLSIWILGMFNPSPDDDDRRPRSRPARRPSSARSSTTPTSARSRPTG